MLFGKDFRTIVSWADNYRRLRIYARVDSYAELEALLKGDYTCDGVGCLSTDFLFDMDSSRRDLTRRILLGGAGDDDNLKMLLQM